MDRGDGVRRSRRNFFWALGATGAIAAGAAAGMVEDLLPGGPQLRRAVGLTGTDGKVPDVQPGPVRSLQFRSAARSTDVRLIIMSPPGAAPGLPVCVALHGRGGSAQGLADLGLPKFLAAAVASGVPPFTIVAVDGGDATYWHRRTAGDDPMAMLVDELPGRLAAEGLPAPSSALGISMGGSGALQYGRARQGKLDAIALLSPALFRSWPDARTIDGFRDEADWREHEPLLHLDQPLTGRLGVWCGTEDPFCPAVRTLRSRAAEAHFPRGEHSGGFWDRVLPDALKLIGRASSTGRQGNSPLTGG